MTKVSNTPKNKSDSKAFDSRIIFRNENSENISMRT